MPKVNFLCIRKTVLYELDYLLRRFRLTQALLSLFFLITLIIISLSDTQSFFLGENSPIPNSWEIFKNERLATAIAIFVIALSYFVPWLSYTLDAKREVDQLSTAVEENLIPAIEIELKALKRRFRQKFHLSENIRVTIFIPVRQNVFTWKFQMVCRTKNVPEKELLARFGLDEGVIGYTFLKNKKHRIEFINFANLTRLPSGYKHLTDENEVLINGGIQVVLVAAVFQEGSIAGLLAIDSDNSDNILRMEDTLLHDEALDWIIARSKAIRLLWRMKNNV